MSRLAGVLSRRGVGKGDLVVIYMPMVPQAMVTMLACARLGAPHSLIFGGFASKELSVRIDHAKVGLARPSVVCLSVCLSVVCVCTVNALILACIQLAAGLQQCLSVCGVK